MTYPIKLSTFAAMLVMMVDGQVNPPYNNPYTPPSVYPGYPPVYPPQKTQLPQQQYLNPYPPNPTSYGTFPAPTYNQYMSPPGYPTPGPYRQPSEPYKQNYLTYTKQAVDCADQTCLPNECCENNGKSMVCVLQNATINNGYCVRPKRCDNNGNCPSGHCCVSRLDVYSTYSPAPYYGAMIKRESQERGECVLSMPVGNICRMPIDKVSTSVCPCTGSTCVFSSGNHYTGICT